MAKKRNKESLITHTTVFGAALAMVISYSEHHHIAWAILHGILNWLYVIYYTIVHVILK